MSKLSGKIQTVLGAIDPTELGITMAHEHLVVDVECNFIMPEEATAKSMIDVKVSKEEELFLTLTDSEKVGFRYAKETTWPKVTKQIKRIHKMALPDPEIATTLPLKESLFKASIF